MKAATRNFYLGLFVLTGLALLLATLFAFGMSEMFVSKARAVTWFSESVQGLAVGSPVKYKGVPIGNVKKITIQLNDKLIQVDMDIELNIFKFKPGASDVDSATTLYEFLNAETQRGLRCRLEYSGLTGMKYVEIDYFGDDRPNEKALTPPDVAYAGAFIPSKPSSLNDMLGMLTNSLAGIAKVDFEGISNDLRASAQSFDRLLNDPELKKTLSNIQMVSKNLETSTAVLAETLTEEEIRSVLDSLHKTATGIQDLTAQIEQQLTASDLPGSTESFRDAMGTITQSRSTLEDTALELRRTLQSVNSLIEVFSKDPGAFLRGKSTKPLDIRDYMQ